MVPPGIQDTGGAPAAARRQPVEVSLKRIRVAVVDDEPEVVELASVVIRREADLELVATGLNGRDAIQIADRTHPDVMVMDVHMPLMTGIDAAERIRSGFPSIAIVLTTGLETLELVKRALRIGVSEFLSKPVAGSDLTAAIRKVDAHRDRQAKEPGLPRVWAFFGSKGTAGTTTMATNTACLLAARDEGVVLVDADLIAGDCAFHLDLQPSGKSLSAILTAAEPVDLALVEAQLRTWRDMKTGTSFTVLESKPEFADPPADLESRFTSLLDILSARFRHIVVDLPPGRLFDVQVAVTAEYCDDFVCVTNSDLPSLKSLSAQLRALSESRFPLDKVTVLVNELVTQGDVDAVEWIGERFKGLRAIHRVPVDRAAVDHAFASGRPLCLVNSLHPMSRMLEKFVSGIHAKVSDEDQARWGEKLWRAVAPPTWRPA